MDNSTGSKAQGKTCAEQPRPQAMPVVDFITFILSLYKSAACHMGTSPHPETGACAIDLPLAKETIDILGLLQQKTKGNLNGEEERILAEVLYDLRVSYVQATKDK